MKLFFEHVCLIILFLSCFYMNYPFGKFQKTVIPAYSQFAKFSFFLALIGWLLLRTSTRWYAPFSNFYESLVFFGIVYLIKCFFIRSSLKFYLSIPGFLLILIALMLPFSYKQAAAIPATLQSWWIFIHVPSYFVGYVSLSMAAIYSFLSMLLSKEKFTKLARSMQRELRIAWLFCNVGLISGAIWADLSWGRFWSWDPKETWALVTWVFLALALHCRRKLRLQRTLVILSFLMMLWTYFGVSFLLKGLHSYF